MSSNAELESFMDEAIRRFTEKGYTPTVFTSMRADLGTVEAIKRLVRSRRIQAGFLRLNEIGLLDWSVEAAVLKFPNLFTTDEREAAKWRLDQAKNLDSPYNPKPEEDLPNIPTLTRKKKSLPDKYQPLAIRIRRATSWLDRAKQESNDQARFLFLWIAFNTAYLRVIKATEGKPKETEQRSLKIYFQMLLQLDLTNRIHAALQVSSPEQTISDTQQHLKTLFQSFRYLRNKLMHGGTISSEKRKQIGESADCMEKLLPIFLDLMLDNPHEDWGKPFYILTEDFEGWSIHRFFQNEQFEPIAELPAEDFINHPGAAELQQILNQQDSLSTSLSLHLQNAIDWLQRAEQQTDDLTACFLFLWTGFNAVYVDFFPHRRGFGEQKKFDAYLENLANIHADDRIRTAIKEKFCPNDAPYPKFLENRFIYPPFWQHYHYRSASDWQSRLSQEKQQFEQMDTTQRLTTIFNRLYKLRNQLFHGSVTWKSGVARVAREQIIDGVKIIGWLLPVFIDLTIKNHAKIKKGCTKKP